MEERTPIEVMLGMTEDGLVSARKLYEFLELDLSHYARWCRDNIIENPAIIEGEDYFIAESGMVEGFRHNGENYEELETRMVDSFQPTVENSRGGRLSTDYLLTIEFAKELCMTCRTERGRQARDYFKKCEKALVITVKEYNALSTKVDDMKYLYDKMQKRLEEYGALATSIAAKLESTEGGSTFAVDHDTQWIHDNYLRVKRLAEKRGMSVADCLTMLVEEMDESGQLDYSYAELARDYKTHHPNQKAERLAVLSQDLDSQMAFEYILEKEMDYWDIFDEEEKKGRALLNGFMQEHYVDTEDPGFLAAMDALYERDKKEEQRNVTIWFENK